MKYNTNSWLNGDFFFFFFIIFKKEKYKTGQSTFLSQVDVNTIFCCYFNFCNWNDVLKDDFLQVRTYEADNYMIYFSYIGRIK